MFEQSDVIGAYWHPYIQLKQKVIPPPGEVKPESEIYRLLAERIGLPSEAVYHALATRAGDEVVAELETEEQTETDEERLEPFGSPSLS